jgi:hypothetical protein
MRRAIAVTAVLMIVILMEPLALVEVADANPTWGKPATPIPPIKDPPQIIINSPSPTVYSNPVPLNITIIQPNSWISSSKYSMTLPPSWVDNSDDLVIGQNTIRSITCILDGTSFTLWNGTAAPTTTHFDIGVSYYLPIVTQFSALMNLSKGQHSLQVSVVAISDYVTEGIIPFAFREYIISTNQSTTFYLMNGSNSTWSPTVESVKSSYEIWQSSDSTTSPSPTSTTTPLTSSSSAIVSNYLPVSIFIAAVLFVLGLIAITAAIVIYTRRKLSKTIDSKTLES